MYSSTCISAFSPKYLNTYDYFKLACKTVNNSYVQIAPEDLFL